MPARGGIKELPFRNFSGGLNTRDTASELQENELTYASNVTIDERGGAMKRLGYSDRYGAQIGTGLVSNIFYWKSQNKVVKQIGANIHVDGAASIKTFTTSDRVGFAEFLGNLYIIHPVDKVFQVTPALSVSGPIANSPKGTCLATWQNKLWCGGDPDNPPRLTRSAAGAATFTPDFVDVREKDSSIITALGGASGLDISGRPGLLVFKEESTYRVNDSSTSAYTTVDANVGSSSNIGIINAYGRTYCISQKGIYSSDGLAPMREESAKIENLFNRLQINTTRGDLYAAGKYMDRLYFSVPRASQTANTLALEYHPLQGWVMPHTNAASAYATTPTEMIFGDPANAGRIYNSHRTGADNGANITSALQARWIEPRQGNLTRVRRVRVIGLGSFTLTVFKDYELGSSLVGLNVAITPGAAIYDDANAKYDTNSSYGPTAFQGFQDFYSIGVVRACCIRVDETSSISLTGRDIMGGTNLPEIGGWTLSHVELWTIDLGDR